MTNTDAYTRRVISMLCRTLAVRLVQHTFYLHLLAERRCSICSWLVCVYVCESFCRVLGSSKEYNEGTAYLFYSSGIVEERVVQHRLYLCCLLGVTGGADGSVSSRFRQEPSLCASRVIQREREERSCCCCSMLHRMTFLQTLSLSRARARANSSRAVRIPVERDDGGYTQAR